MIPQRIHALFDFIDYLDSNKKEYIEKYLPLCNELYFLNTKRSALNPHLNYLNKQRYDEIQKVINEKFEPITDNIYIPTITKLKELDIWAGDYVMTSIWNNNIKAVHDLKENFSPDDVLMIKIYKEKYLNFRTETNSNFLCLQMVFSSLDEILKVLFDFFKDTSENEFANFEAKSIHVNSLQEALEYSIANDGSNLKFSLPQTSLFDYYHIPQLQNHLNHVKNEVIMGDKIQIGDIKHNSGQIVVGKSITISDSFNKKNETVAKLSELISLIRKEENINDDQKQLLITNFDKVKEELFEEQPSQSKIFKWLSKTKDLLEKLVLSHEVTEAVKWIYTNLNFIFH